MRQHTTIQKDHGHQHFLFALALVIGIGVFVLDVPGQIKQIGSAYQANIAAHQRQIDALGE